MPECSDYTTTTTCRAAGCSYEPAIGYCREMGANIPCERFFTPQLCTFQPSCRFNNLTQTCADAVAGPPCADFSAMPSACPTTRCRYDTAAKLCLGREANPPCSRYGRGMRRLFAKPYVRFSTMMPAASCPVPDIEFQLLPATPIQDATCRIADVCTMDEWESQALTPSSDRYVRVQAAICMLSCFETRSIGVHH